MKWCGFVVPALDSSSESDDGDNNFYSMSDARRRNHGHQWQDRVQRQSQLCVTLSINKGRLLGCTASQVIIAISSVLLWHHYKIFKTLFWYLMIFVYFLLLLAYYMHIRPVVQMSYLWSWYDDDDFIGMAANRLD